MDARIARIENSEGVCLPESLNEEPDPEERPSSRVINDDLQIEARSEVRAGWVEAARLARERGDDTLVGTWPPTGFDTAEWEWESSEGDG